MYFHLLLSSPMHRKFKIRQICDICSLWIVYFCLQILDRWVFFLKWTISGSIDELLYCEGDSVIKNAPRRNLYLTRTWHMLHFLIIYMTGTLLHVNKLFSFFPLNVHVSTTLYLLLEFSFFLISEYRCEISPCRLEQRPGSCREQPDLFTSTVSDWEDRKECSSPGLWRIQW